MASILYFAVCLIALLLFVFEVDAFVQPSSALGGSSSLQQLQQMKPTKMIVDDSLNTLIQSSSNILSYSDEATDTNTLVLGTIGLFSVATAVIFGVLLAGLSKPSAGKIELSEEEEVIVGSISNVFDATEKDRQITERGTIGEVNRKKKAESAKTAYQKGKDPREVRDRTLNYAEIDLSFLIALLRNAKPQPGDVFFDLGSGTGKAVLTAAKLYDWSKCVGVEFLQPLTAMAKSFQGKAAKVPGYSPSVEFITNDFCNPEVDVSQADVLFAYSSKYDSNGLYLTELSAKLAECKPGARIITIDKRLKGPFKLVRELEDPNGDLQTLRGFVWERN
mmetsp:Transcript_22252/g.29088  ORF Transcript_22252/g.29088 Transcript_22252/m.29088 type:complete len:334 (+) Transcript_22252:88-1089(+)